MAGYHHILDLGRFSILLQSSLDCKKIYVQDLSDWFIDEKYSIPESYQLEIYFPYNTKPFIVEIFTNKVNVFTMKDFGFGKDSVFMTGIYCFKVKFPDKEYRIYRALLCRFISCYDKYLAITELEDLNSNILKLEFVNRLIHRIPYLVEVDRIKEAEHLFKMLETEIKYLNCNC